jgi:hypothetical protein
MRKKKKVDNDYHDYNHQDQKNISSPILFVIGFSQYLDIG